MSRNNQLEAENKRLSQKVEEMKEICTLTSTMNVKIKSQLEQESIDKDSLKQSNLKLKVSLNKLTMKCNELNQRVKVLETNLKRKVMTRMNQPKVQIIKSASDVVRSDTMDMENLQRRYDELEAEHQEALNVIDELEFELGDVIILNFPVCQAKGFSVIF
jgi:chromosome segregation ATPase